MLAALALLAAIGAMAILIGNVIPHPREHALGATAAALFGYVVLHAGIGLLFLLSNFMRLATSFISPRRLTDERLPGSGLTTRQSQERSRSVLFWHCPRSWASWECDRDGASPQKRSEAAKDGGFVQ